MVARADMESAPTMKRTLGNNAKLHGASGTPPPTSHHCKGCRGEQCSPGEFGGSARSSERMQASAPTATAKPPLCKGRWHGVSRDGGIGACAGALGCIRKTTIPQSALRLTPLTRPGPSVAARHLPTLWGVTLYTREPLLYHPQISVYPVRADDEHRPLQNVGRVLSAPEGSMRREVKKREEKRSTPAFFSFFTSRPPLWGSQGAGPLGRASRAIGSSGHLFRFLFGCPKRKD